MSEFMHCAALGSSAADKEEIRAALATLRESNAKASAALDSALTNIAAREREWEAREQRAVEEGRALAETLGWGA
jgi:hypothetical protein